MRLVAWNCAMAFHRKYEALLSLEPDVAVISECAHPDRVRAKLDGLELPAELTWIGTNPNKGIGVLAFNGYRLTLEPVQDTALRYVVPIAVSGPATFTLFAVWAQNLSGGNYRKDQPGPLRQSLDRYRTLFARGDVVAAGDFNNNVIWDRPGWPINHADAVELLAGHGLVSAYHHLTGDTQGRERTPTLYWRDRKKDGPTYHLDYVFAPEAWLDPGATFEVGSFEDWCGSGLSDHVPVTLAVEVPRGR